MDVALGLQIVATTLGALSSGTSAILWLHTSSATAVVSTMLGSASSRVPVGSYSLHSPRLHVRLELLTSIGLAAVVPRRAASIHLGALEW
jgi:hypothetical protein